WPGGSYADMPATRRGRSKTPTTVRTPHSPRPGCHNPESAGSPGGFMLARGAPEGCPPCLRVARRAALAPTRGAGRPAGNNPAERIALEARMTPRTLRWVTGSVAALSIALLLGGLPLAYLGRHVATAGLWNFPDVFEVLTFVAVPVVGFVLVSRRPANKIGQ